jgi:hypothetical protein
MRRRKLIDAGHFWVQQKMCPTCIYRKDSVLDLAKLERDVADPHIPGRFKSYRTCHHARQACCRGFWNRHKDKFMLGQLAQRLGLVKFVTDNDGDR